MKWSFRLGSPFGIPVYLHITFLALFGFLTFAAFARGGAGAALATVALVTAVFGSVVLHEFGHALTARWFGVGTRDVTLYPIGGVASLERMPRDPRQELWIALAGPAVNVAIAGLLGVWLALSGFAGSVGLASGSFAGRVLAINLGLVVFNMLPAFPMDGGRVLRALLARRIGHLRATEIAATVGKGMAILLGFAGLFGNTMLMLIAVFVWFGASQELLAARMPRWTRAPHPFDRDGFDGGPGDPPAQARVWIRRFP